MESELHALLNVAARYKESLSNVLGRIDDCLLQVAASSLSTDSLSITKKYKRSHIMIDAVQKYLRMLYMSENLLEQLLSEMSEMDLDTQPERDRQDWNPFHSTLSSSFSCSDPTIPKTFETTQSLQYCTASSETDTFHGTVLERISPSYCTVDSVAQTDTFEVVNAVVQTDNELEVQSLTSSSEPPSENDAVVNDDGIIIEALENDISIYQIEGKDSHNYDTEQVLEDETDTQLRNVVNDNGIITEAPENDIPIYQNEGQDSDNSDTDQVWEDETDTQLKETLLNLPELPPRKYFRPEVKVKSSISFKIKSKRQTLGVSPLCQSPESDEDTKLPRPSPCWREEASKLFDNQKVRSYFKRVAASQVTNKLQSSMKSKEKAVICDILEGEVHINDICTFSHIQTPSEFYIHVGGPTLCRELDDALNEDMNSKCQYVVNKYKSKEEAKTHLGNFCFAFIASKRKWFRVEVLDWMFEDTERIFVHIIDYGEKTYCVYTHLQAMTELYAKIPRLAVRCHLAALYSTDSENRRKWSKASTDCLSELAGMKKTTKFKILYLNKERDSYGVDLLQEGDKNNGSVGEVLVSRGLANQDEVTQDDNLEKISEEDSEDSESCENLNKAEADYNARNEARLCPFTDETGSKCFSGPACKLEHTAAKAAAALQTIASFMLPPSNKYVTILITGCVNPCNFYAHILINPSNSTPQYNVEYLKLRDAMNANNVIQTYEKLKVSPAPEELVLVKEGFEWQRGRCVAVEKENIYIFLVDFGSVVIKNIEDLRKMRDAFLSVPQQAIECVLHQCEVKPNVPGGQAMEFFYSAMHLRSFNALVINSAIPLRLRLWDDKGVDMDHVLKSYGIGRQIKRISN